MSYDGLPSVTKMHVQGTSDIAMEILIATLEDVLIQYKQIDNVVAFSTVDGDKNMITGEILVRDRGNESVIVFQRTRGNCIEYKKMYNAIRDRFIEMAEGKRR